MKIPQFVKAYSTQSPLMVHRKDHSAGPLIELPFLSSLEALLKSWRCPIEAHLPDVRDEASAIETSVQDAQKLFDNGMGLLFKEAQVLAPLMEEWLHDLRRELGISQLTQGRCLIYVTPDGKGTAPHFDQNINFVLQIYGTKKWIMAPNEHVTNPMSRHTMGQHVDPELMSYLENPLPTSMPENAESYELKPGSLLFVPRGYWHSTEAEGDALSLNFTYTAPTWIDLLTAALRGRLAQSPEWRETANLSEERLDYLLSQLREDVPSWRGQDILSVTENY